MFVGWLASIKQSKLSISILILGILAHGIETKSCGFARPWNKKPWTIKHGNMRHSSPTWNKICLPTPLKSHPDSRGNKPDETCQWFYASSWILSPSLPPALSLRTKLRSASNSPYRRESNINLLFKLLAKKKKQDNPISQNVSTIPSRVQICWGALKQQTFG